MKCHYEVLNVTRDAVLDDIKKAYKKLAIKWHPDKNLENTEAATEQFQLIQQAFEVLSDSHERAWYDDHRDAILKGKVGVECEDDSLDVYQYFTASCYKGFGDDEKGFYSVYREVFNKITAEDSEYFQVGDSDDEVPNFGKSTSAADEVKMFYAYWQSYCTKKTYSWLDPYDTRTAENRRVSRLIDKENKKVRDKARKARNEEVRELVNFVRKRDKRVQAYAQELQNLNAEKAKKTEKRRQETIKKRKEELASHKESEWSKFSNLETELQNIEANVASEFGESTSDDTIIDDQLYCIACNKLFKTTKAFQNHESSKKHKDNVLVLKQNMLEGSNSEIDSDEESPAEEGEVVYEYDGVVPDDLENDPLFCDPCGKQFKTPMAIENHKKTKKHLDNYKMYKEAMIDVLGKDEFSDSDKSTNDPFAEPKAIFKELLGNDDTSERFNGDLSQHLCSQIDEFTKDNDTIKEDVDRICKQLEDLFDGGNSTSFESDDHSAGFAQERPRSLKKEIKSKHKNVLDSDDDDDDDFFSDSRKKQKKKQKTKAKSQNDRKKNVENCSANETDSSAVNSIEKESETSSVSQDSVSVTKSTVSSKEKTTNKSNSRKKRQTEDSVNDKDSTCAVCKTSFPSKNKLFLHLSNTGHSIYLGEKDKLLMKVKEQDLECNTNKKSRSRKKL